MFILQRRCRRVTSTSSETTQNQPAAAHTQLMPHLCNLDAGISAPVVAALATTLVLHAHDPKVSLRVSLRHMWSDYSEGAGDPWEQKSWFGGWPDGDWA